MKYVKKRNEIINKKCKKKIQQKTLARHNFHKSHFKRALHFTFQRNISKTSSRTASHGRVNGPKN